MRAIHFITGVTGQDGILLARALIARGASVIGTVEPGADVAPLTCYLDGIELVEHDVRDIDTFSQLMAEHKPAAVYNLAAQSSVGASWADPTNTREVNELAVTGMLEAISRIGATAPSFVQASSSEIFGHVATGVANESTAVMPVSPYGEAKAAAGRAVARAREQGMHATNLILFGHTSPLQAPRFVLPQLVRSAVAVARGTATTIDLHDPTVSRDWGSASDVVRAFSLAASGTPGDYVIGTGVLHSLAEIASWALADLDVAAPIVKSGEPRKHDHDGVRADAGHASRHLGWQPTHDLSSVIRHMVRVESERVATGARHSPNYLVES